MRWFIEVSRLGEDTPIEKYCLEAKQWQAALQEARKRRGDTGPLSKFSIELLEHGYRAVDPAQKIRYVVNKAPADSALSQPPPAGETGTAPGSFPAPAKLPNVAASSPVITSAADPTDPVASPGPRSDPLAAGPKTDPMAALPPESHPPRTEPIPQPAPPRPTSTRSPITVPDDQVPPIGGGSPSSTTQPMTSPVPTTAQPPGQMTQRSMEAAREPDFQVIKKREEEPNEKVPIAYREYAYAVKPGTDRSSVEVLLWMRFRELAASLEGRTHKKFIQLAVFDHVFEKKPARAPVATLMWKDWRGEPVLQFPSASTPPPDVSSTAPPAVSAAPPAVQAVQTPVIAPQPVAVTLAPDRTLSTQPAPPSGETERSAPPTQPLSAPAPSAPQPFPPAPSSPQSAPPPVEIPIVVELPPEPVQPAPAAAQPAPAVAQPAPALAAPTPTPATAPLKRRADEDLIGELFEAMHDLHFVPDMMTGVDFVLGILNKTLPSEAVLIHIFDINSRQFVVVRALGPSAQAVVLHRTPDQEAMFRRVMRGTRSTVTTDAASSEAYRNNRWNLLGVVPEVAVIGPVQLHGRFLGAIELANPLGGGAYTEHESHALDYICEQLAEFLAARPIVVDADVVLGKA